MYDVDWLLVTVYLHLLLFWFVPLLVIFIMGIRRLLEEFTLGGPEPFLGDIASFNLFSF